MFLVIQLTTIDWLKKHNIFRRFDLDNVMKLFYLDTLWA